MKRGGEGERKREVRKKGKGDKKRRGAENEPLDGFLGLFLQKAGGRGSQKRGEGKRKSKKRGGCVVYAEEIITKDSRIFSLLSLNKSNSGLINDK